MGLARNNYLSTLCLGPTLNVGHMFGIGKHRVLESWYCRDLFESTSIKCILLQIDMTRICLGPQQGFDIIGR